MAILHFGAKKVRKDHRDYSYPRTFGTTTTFPDELILDTSERFPDQNADGYPNGCTGYTTTSICEDQDNAEYDPAFTYKKTRLMEGTYPADVGCDIRDALQSAIDYGLLPKGEKDESQAGYHRRGAYFAVVDSPDLDAFDDVRNALMSGQSVSVGTPWYQEWNGVSPNGVLTLPFTSPLGYHNWKIIGWKQVNGAPVLIGKAWCGKHFADHGYHYMTRKVFNFVMSQPWTGAFMVRKAVPGDIQTIRLAILARVVSYIRMWLAKLISL